MFESPLLLWGILAAGVPVILHLTGRSQPIVHRFPAMRFILKSQRASSRALRLKHWLVLLLRMLAVMLVCMALARPYLNSSSVAACGTFFTVILAAAGAWAFYRREFIAGAMTVLAMLALYTSLPDLSPLLKGSLHGDIVIVLDQSMSMAYQESDGTRFDRARRQINDLLDRLTPDSRVALLLAGKNVERAQGRLTYRVDAVRERLNAATVTSGGLDLSRALQTAEEVLARDQSSRTEGTPKQIVIFTDLQRNSFDTFSSLRTPRSGASPQSSVLSPQSSLVSPSVVFVDVGSDEARNGGVLEVALPGTILPVDATETLSAKVRLLDKNHASLVELFLDGKRVDQNLVNSAGRDSADVEFRFQTGAAGPHALTVRLADPDRLAIDQEYHVTYVAGRPARALILETPKSETDESMRRGTGFFIGKVLQPSAGTSDDSGLGISGLSCVIQAPEELTAAKLANYKVVILADCGTLTDGTWNALLQWTNDGGGLFVWAGPNTDPASLRKYGFQEFAVHRGLLPASVGLMIVNDPPLNVNIVAPEHPLLSHFTKDVSRELSRTSIRRMVKVWPDTGESASTVVLTAGDNPLLLEKSYGRGRVVMFTIDPGLECSDLVKRGGSFVSLVLDAVRLLAQSETDVNARLGQPLALTLPSTPVDGKVLWNVPGVDQSTVLRAENLNAAEPSLATKNVDRPITLSVPPLTATGIHRFSWTPASSKLPLQRLVAINHDPGEVDLAKIPKAEAEKALEAFKPEIVKGFSDASLFKDQSVQSSDERKHEFSASLIVVLLALLLAESFLSNRFYRGDDEVVDGAS
jgi:hypothetical protein